jgi:hypothetical protein
MVDALGPIIQWLAGAALIAIVAGVVLWAVLWVVTSVAMAVVWVIETYGPVLALVGVIVGLAYIAG